MKSDTVEEKIRIQTYYKMRYGRVIQYEKIGNNEWTSAVTSYTELPYTELLDRPYIPLSHPTGDRGKKL